MEYSLLNKESEAIVNLYVKNNPSAVVSQTAFEALFRKLLHFNLVDRVSEMQGASSTFPRSPTPRGAKSSLAGIGNQQVSPGGSRPETERFEGSGFGLITSPVPSPRFAPPRPPRRSKSPEGSQRSGSLKSSRRPKSPKDSQRPKSPEDSLALALQSPDVLPEGDSTFSEESTGIIPGSPLGSSTPVRSKEMDNIATPFLPSSWTTESRRSSAGLGNDARRPSEDSPLDINESRRNTGAAGSPVGPGYDSDTSRRGSMVIEGRSNPRLEGDSGDFVPDSPWLDVSISHVAEEGLSNEDACTLLGDFRRLSREFGELSRDHELRGKMLEEESSKVGLAQDTSHELSYWEEGYREVEGQHRDLKDKYEAAVKQVRKLTAENEKTTAMLLETEERLKKSIDEKEDLKLLYRQHTKKTRGSQGEEAETVKSLRADLEDTKRMADKLSSEASNYIAEIDQLREEVANREDELWRKDAEVIEERMKVGRLETEVEELRRDIGTLESIGYIKGIRTIRSNGSGSVKGALKTLMEEVPSLEDEQPYTLAGFFRDFPDQRPTSFRHFLQLCPDLCWRPYQSLPEISNDFPELRELIPNAPQTGTSPSTTHTGDTTSTDNPETNPSTVGSGPRVLFNPDLAVISSPRGRPVSRSVSPSPGAVRTRPVFSTTLSPSPSGHFVMQCNESQWEQGAEPECTVKSAGLSWRATGPSSRTAPTSLPPRDYLPNPSLTPDETHGDRYRDRSPRARYAYDGNDDGDEDSDEGDRGDGGSESRDSRNGGDVGDGDPNNGGDGGGDEGEGFSDDGGSNNGGNGGGGDPSDGRDGGEGGGGGGGGGIGGDPSDGGGFRGQWGNGVDPRIPAPDGDYIEHIVTTLPTRARLQRLAEKPRITIEEATFVSGFVESQSSPPDTVILKTVWTLANKVEGATRRSMRESRRPSRSGKSRVWPLPLYNPFGVLAWPLRMIWDIAHGLDWADYEALALDRRVDYTPGDGQEANSLPTPPAEGTGNTTTSPAPASSSSSSTSSKDSAGRFPGYSPTGAAAILRARPKPSASWSIMTMILLITLGILTIHNAIMFLRLRDDRNAWEAAHGATPLGPFWALDSTCWSRCVSGFGNSYSWRPWSWIGDSLEQWAGIDTGTLPS